ncbi:MAG: hypothetical protein CMD12_07615 [Flavobacteriales bacterium]|nr:hypothetical protein [Flavobacteriales bacterium]|tara:strand:- start:1258 stop:1971 length:714 start_codon:yes stop_codon:yes gene_type:complete
MSYEIDLSDYDFFKILPRVKTIEVYKKLLYYYENEIIKKTKKQKLPEKGDDNYLNPYFKNPPAYKHYNLANDIHPKEILDVDLSLPSISSLLWLSKNKIEDKRILDYGCGISGFLVYINNFGYGLGYDNCEQIGYKIIDKFLELVDNKIQIVKDKKTVFEFSPQIISVHGIWLEDWVYQIPSIEYILSDRLYCSGAIPGEGANFFNKDFKNSPSDKGFKKISSLPFLDIFKRINPNG